MTPDSTPPTPPSWTVRQAVLGAAIPFVLGAMLGVLARRVEPPKPRVATVPPASAARPAPALTPASVTPERVKHMADKKAEPLLAELKSKPDDPVLLAKVGNIYYVTRNYSEACTYFQRSLDIKEDPVLRVELGRAYFYAGDPDQALSQFEKVLKTDPGNANAMFNIGMIKWQSKFDVDGAMAAWKQLLKQHPNHPRRAEVEKLIARARQHRDLKRPSAKP